MTTEEVKPRGRMRKWLGRLGLAVLVSALPLALLAIVAPPNDYKAEGIDAVDCDGPAVVFLLAVPALFLYGWGAFAYGFNFRRRRLNLAIAVLCTALCVLMGSNIARAVKEQWLMDADPTVCRW
ncbi:MAG: hypothetical protein LBQ20_07890 [Rhodanobacter sp.]|jgi:hypothetical protein|nr:hypothetical protein [Rhodanobacter sp.]